MIDPARRWIEDYALIGSTETAALISRDGTIEWLCLPDFDSSAIFAALLGSRENGEWRLHARDPAARLARRYLPDTIILETTIETDGGKAVVLDFMPTPVRGGTSELIRIVRCDEGHIGMSTELRLRFQYGADIPWVRRETGAIVATAGPDAVRLTTTLELNNEDFTTHGDFDLSAGQSITMALEWYPSHEEPPLPRDPHALLYRTDRRWREWADACTYEGPYAPVVRRSLLTLNALTYRPTGGIVAAPTTSLPEVIGGVRNWDYRYCWLRDTVMSIHALTGSGYRDEAGAWRQWLLRAVGGTPDDLQIMYGLRGERRLTEFELDHLTGYEGSRPVRVGNAAHDQVQLDVFGSVMGEFDAARRSGLPMVEDAWPLQRAIAKHLLTIWQEPDSSLWEIRGKPRHYVFSKVMCWFAFDRMVASAEDFGLDGPIDEWRAARDTIHADICAKGFDEKSGSFVQFYGADAVDAALLRLPVIGFLPPDDPRMQGTIARIERDLVEDGVVYRYRAGDADGGDDGQVDGDGQAHGDGLPGREGAFLACSFWLCDAMALAGRMDDATALFERLLGYGSDLGLFAEEYDPQDCRQLGNFPQAFSHFALINTALTLAGQGLTCGKRAKHEKER